MRLSPKFFSLLLCLLLSVNGVAQQAQNTVIDEDKTLVRVDTDLVAIDVTVTDSQGNYLVDLRQQDFELLEDGVVRPIEFFQPTKTLQQSPLALVIALDLSGSLSAEETVMQRRSIEQFVQMIDSNSVCALLGFNYKVDILQDFTGDRKKLAKKIENIKDYGGSTRIYDGLDRAIALLKKAPQIKAGKRLRRVILVVTDGFDSASIIDKKELVRRANLSGVTIYSVTIPSYSPLSGKGSNQDRLPTLLDITRIPEMTGGRDFPVVNNDFAAVFDAIGRELAAGYTLAYYPPRDRRANEFHKLEVRVKRQGVLTRVSRDGYIVDAK
jgi:Ca-activated chloride channel homolog